MIQESNFPIRVLNLAYVLYIGTRGARTRASGRYINIYIVTYIFIHKNTYV